MGKKIFFQKALQKMLPEKTPAEHGNPLRVARRPPNYKLKQLTSGVKSIELPLNSMVKSFNKELD